jgi:RHS repeat-associated protein
VKDYADDANVNRTFEREDLGGAPLATYDAQDRLLTYGPKSYTYSEAGELETVTEAGQTTTYGYDALNALRTVTLPNATQIDYVIDGLGRRVGKRVNGVLQQGLLYGDQLRITAELDGSGAVVSRFVYATRPNVPEYLVKAGQTYRLLSDHLGSVRLVVDVATGAVAQRIDYDGFGVVTADTNPGFQPFGFAGGLYDRDTGLVRFGARDYDASTGRWTAKDPIGFYGGEANLYVYGLDDPVGAVDFDGQRFVMAGGRAALVAGVGGEVGVGVYVGLHEGESQGQGLFGTNFDLGLYGTIGAGVGLEASAGLEGGLVREASGLALNINGGVPLIGGGSLVLDPKPCGPGFANFVNGATAGPGPLGVGGGLSITATQTGTTTEAARALLDALRNALR